MRYLLTALTLAGVLQAPQASADSPIVVELYTSQGCSSCPPADAYLHDLAKRDDIIALALHVDYWDYIGWKDSFASPQFTSRQHSYAAAANAAVVYTPQMVVNGRDHVVGSRPLQVMNAVDDQRRRGSVVDVALARVGDDVQIKADTQTPGEYLVQLVRYTPYQTVDIRRGENAGREISYANVVKSWDVVGPWDGTAALDVTTAVDGDEPIVVIVQRSSNGPIVGAAELR